MRLTRVCIALPLALLLLVTVHFPQVHAAEEPVADPDETEAAAREKAEKRKAMDGEISSLYTEAVTAYNKGDYRKALRNLKSMIQRAPFILPAHVAAIKSALQLQMPTEELVEMITAAIEASKEVKRIGIQESLVEKFCAELMTVLRVTEGQFANNELVGLGKTLRQVCATDDEDMFLEDVTNMELDAHPKRQEFTPQPSSVSCESSEVCNVDQSIQVDAKPGKSPFGSDDGGDEPDAAPSVCMCGFVDSGTNAMLFDWIKSQECVGVNHIVLLDARELSEQATAVRDWVLRPYLHRKYVEQVFVHPEERLETTVKEGTRWAWDKETQDWLLVRERWTQSALLTETCSVSCSGYDWQVEMNAPGTSLVGDLRVLRNVPSEASEVIVPAVEYTEPKPSEQKPPRPFHVTHVSTLSSLRSCRREDDSTYLEASVSTRIVHTHGSKKSKQSPVVLLPSQGLRLASFLQNDTGDVTSGEKDERVDDYTVYKSFAACNRQGLQFNTTSGAVEEIEQGNGGIVVSEAIDRHEAIEIRENILKVIPTYKQRRRVAVFQNHLCQITRGHEEVSSGWDPRCLPLDERVLKLVYNARVLEVVRGLLGEDAQIHNVGMSISGALYTGPLNTHQDQPLPTGNTAWGGRTPPPTHPLSVQVLWIMEDVNFVNGATYILPRTQHRSERIDEWKTNATEEEGLDMGLFPVAYFDGLAGDAFITLGSIWHGASTNLSREPRLVLLIEYCPSFVEPLHTFREEFINAKVPAEHHKLFKLSLAAKIAKPGK